MNGTNILIDSNIILEIVFEQERQEACADLIAAINDELFHPRKVFISRFSLNAIQALSKKESSNFIRDFLLLIYQEKLHIAESSIKMELMANTLRHELGLDFDDTIQYLIALETNSDLVTYDHFPEKSLSP